MHYHHTTVDTAFMIEWSHLTFLFTDSNVTPTMYNMMDCTIGKYCSVAFI